MSSPSQASPSQASPSQARHGELFAAALAAVDPDATIAVLCHNDADGLSAGALVARALTRAGRPVRTRIVGRGQTPWSDEVVADLAGEPLGGLIVADLGIRPGPLRPDLPTIFIDHHVPLGFPPGATIVSGYGEEPTPTSSLLAFWCAQAIAAVDDLLWIAAIGIVGDLGDAAPFPELAEARKRFGATNLRQATSLLNAPRRAGSGDAQPALDLLLKADNPREIISGVHPETARLHEARAEVKAAVDSAKKVAPLIRDDIALFRLHSPCQVHPLVAQTWRGRLKDKIVIAANTGFRPGWVHFSARSATGRNLVAFLREVAPTGADDNYGGGHEQASGGALRIEDWREFLSRIGFVDVAHAAEKELAA